MMGCLSLAHQVFLHKPSSQTVDFSSFKGGILKESGSNGSSRKEEGER